MSYRRLTLVPLTVLVVVALSAAVRNAVDRKAALPSAATTRAKRPATVSRSAALRGTATVDESVLIKNVPHVRQKPDFCGEACAASYLQKLGFAVDQDYVFDQSGLDPLQARGCHTKELAAALRNIGFRTSPVWARIPAARQSEHLRSHWKALHADLVRGVPSIICMYYERPGVGEHFRLILGYDAKSDEVIYQEPAEADGAYRRMKRASLWRLWPLKYSENERTVIRLRLEPGRLKAGKAAKTLTAADYAQHLMRLKKKVPAEGFTIIIQPPFVVIGDESPAMVRRRAEGTVKWAVERLKESYFARDPTEILDIWLFRDKASYQKHCRSIFNHTPHTPFGYYSDTDKALVMNIATGGGTLVHEIVHPFVAANFPACPAWFNEGLGSLYEQSAERNGQIVGLTNWRLAGLQDAIRNKQVPSFKTLCLTTDGEFYHQDKGTNYAQARYLCYYLQQHGLLRKFYHGFAANRQKDPTGYQTLRAVLGRGDMEAFKKDWEAYVLKLRFP
jgi:hypothetical protein